MHGCTENCLLPISTTAIFHFFTSGLQRCCSCSWPAIETRIHSFRTTWHLHACYLMSISSVIEAFSFLGAKQASSVPGDHLRKHSSKSRDIQAQCLLLYERKRSGPLTTGHEAVLLVSSQKSVYPEDRMRGLALHGYASCKSCQNWAIPPRAYSRRPCVLQIDTFGDDSARSMSAGVLPGEDSALPRACFLHLRRRCTG